MPKLYLYRGLPGAAKTTNANKHGCLVVSPLDMYAYSNGKYDYSNRVGESRQKKRQIKDFWHKIIAEVLRVGCDVCVAEVCPTVKSVNVYKQLALENSADFELTSCIICAETSKVRNVHAVPENIIDSMAKAWQDYSGEKIINTEKFS